MSTKVKVSIKAKGILNFANCCVGQPMVSSVELENIGDVDLKDLRLVLRAENDELSKTTFDVDKLKIGEKYSRSAATIRPAAGVMQRVTEEYESAIHAEVFDGTELIGATSQFVYVQPVDMWAGFEATPALAGFCIPNHPALNAPCARAAELLKERQGSAMLNGYGNSDPKWPAHQARSAFDALIEQGLSYSLPPESFGHGQRIRLAHRVLEEKKGTCIDLAFAYASLLAALRLDPIIVMYNKHAYAGFWTKPSSQRPATLSAFNKKAASLLALTEGPDASIVLVECTVLAHGAAASFETAVASATRQLKEKTGFEYWLDIHSARQRGGLPMPLFADAEGSGENAPDQPADPCADEELPFGPSAGEGANAGDDEGAGNAGEGEGENAAEGGDTDEGADNAGDDEGACAGGSAGGAPGEKPAGPKKPAKDPVIDDVREHAAELGYSPITRALMGEALEGAHEEVAEPAFIDPTGMTAPLASDASQLHAVQYVAQGGSCVIEGSPGTGKTQVIVNIAADSMARGRKVLVVLQNEEQLGVVEKRMRSAAMHPFVLKLGKNATSHVLLETLDNACSLSDSSIDSLLAEAGIVGSGEEVDIRQGVELARELDDYATALQLKNEAGLSLREQILGYQEFRDAEDAVFLGRDSIAALQSKQDFARALSLIDKICLHAEGMGDLQGHSFDSLGISLEDLTPQEVRQQALSRKAEIEDAISWYAEFCDNFTGGEDCNCDNFTGGEDCNCDNFAGGEDCNCDSFAGGEDCNRDGDVNWEEAMEVLASLQDIAAGKWVDSDAAAKAQDLLYDSVMAAACAEEMALQLEGLWKNSLFLRSAKDLQSKWEAAASVPFMRRSSAKRAFLEELQEHAWRPLCEADVENALSTLGFYEGQLESSAEALVAVRAELCELLDGEIAALDALYDAADCLHEWIMWRDLAQQAENSGLSGVVASLERGVEPASVARAAKKELFRLMCAESVRASDCVRRFSGTAFERSTQAFAQVDRAVRARSARNLVEKRAHAAKAILADKLFADQVEGLKVSLRSHGRGKAVSELLATFPDVAFGVCPCVLTTPLGVARHLDWGAKFDLVVIDEASQLETERAIGVLERASQAVVVGDPQQLPPTSFFTRKQDLTDIGIQSKGESILDDCVIMGLPKISLRWHYRSRHESLIAFSNEQFYQNKLLTFPSADDLSSRVSLRKVEGVYEGGGINRAEAEAIVEEIKKRYESSKSAGHDLDTSGCGIGVITFNVKQQALVADLLKKEYACDAAFAAWAQQGSECLFVKNLENVQGDERDVILLSITYAADVQGKLSHNFGPVNKAGGERRLNVAFTRARCEMVVFATLSSGEMDVSESSARGVRVMRDFLAYAEGLNAPRNSKQLGKASKDSGDFIAKRLCERLEEMGYRTQRNVGSSHMKIDIAVVDPRDGRRFIAGILLDGDAYRVARSTRDREVGKLDQLRDLGWNLCRVWSVDFLYDERKCIERVLNHLGRLAA